MGISLFFFVFFKFEFYYWDLSFSLKSDIDVTVQPHLKMFGLCATTRVMCVRHLLHDWDTTAFAPVPCWAQLLFQKGGSTSSTPPPEYLLFLILLCWDGTAFICLLFAGADRPPPSFGGAAFLPLFRVASHSYCTCVGCGSPVPLLRLRFVL